MNKSEYQPGDVSEMTRLAIGENQTTCPKCKGDSNVTEDPGTVFYCGSCGCVWGEGRTPRLLEKKAVPLMMLAGAWPPDPMLGKRIK